MVKGDTIRICMYRCFSARHKYTNTHILLFFIIESFEYTHQIQISSQPTMARWGRSAKHHTLNFVLFRRNKLPTAKDKKILNSSKMVQSGILSGERIIQTKIVRPSVKHRRQRISRSHGAKMRSQREREKIGNTRDLLVVHPNCVHVFSIFSFHFRAVAVHPVYAHSNSRLAISAAFCQCFISFSMANKRERVRKWE